MAAIKAPFVEELVGDEEAYFLAQISGRGRIWYLPLVKRKISGHR
jgi:hypothetical protein